MTDTPDLENIVDFSVVQRGAAAGLRPKEALLQQKAHCDADYSYKRLVESNLKSRIKRVSDTEEELSRAHEDLKQTRSRLLAEMSRNTETLRLARQLELENQKLAGEHAALKADMGFFAHKAASASFEADENRLALTLLGACTAVFAIALLLKVRSEDQGR